MKVELKENIWIEGFNKQMSYEDLSRYDSIHLSKSMILYRGKTSEITEELASQCCKYQNIYEGEPSYKEYGDVTWSTYPYVTAKESIQSACQSEFCIIYKTR